MSTLRLLARRFTSTPLHPQWLVPRRHVPDGLTKAKGLLLDIGAADRWIARHLPTDVRYIALDYPIIGRDLYGASPDIYADGGVLPVADGVIDIVTCFEVLEHVESPDAVLREVARVLRPGGVAYFSMPFFYPVHDAPYDYQRWTEYGWRRSAVDAGLVCSRLEPSSSGIEAAGAAACLALAGPLEHAQHWRRWLALPALTVLVPAINLTAWCLARVWSPWHSISLGFRVELRKP